MFRYLVCCAVILSVCVLPHMVHALDCSNESITQNMEECSGQKLVATETDLKETLSELKDKISPAGRQKLQAAEKAWLSYRDKQCDFNTFGSRDAHLYSWMVIECRLGYTEDHLKDLRSQLNCEEGVVGCGGQ